MLGLEGMLALTLSGVSLETGRAGCGGAWGSS